MENFVCNDCGFETQNNVVAARHDFEHKSLSCSHFNCSYYFTGEGNSLGVSCFCLDCRTEVTIPLTSIFDARKVFETLDQGQMAKKIDQIKTRIGANKVRFNPKTKAVSN